MGTGFQVSLIVMFVPGNAGSAEQVRSLGRVLDELDDGILVFTVGFGGELSALSGAVLLRQAEYAAACASAALALLSSAGITAPSTPLWVGHSMGGVVARSVHAFGPAPAALITLSTPHARPAARADALVDLVYGRMVSPAVFASLHGGRRDELVRPGLSHIPSDLGICASTSSIPTVRVSADHRCVLWCKQVVRALAKAIVDAVPRLATGDLRRARTDLARTLDPQPSMHPASGICAAGLDVVPPKGVAPSLDGSSAVVAALPFVVRGEASRAGSFLFHVPASARSRPGYLSVLHSENLACKLMVVTEVGPRRLKLRPTLASHTLKISRVPITPTLQSLQISCSPDQNAMYMSSQFVVLDLHDW